MNNNPINPAPTDEPRMSSLDIAEITGKAHKDVMKAIRNMEPAWQKVNGRNFALVNYTDKKGELRPCYLLTKAESLYVATKFNDEARAKLVLRWQELEEAYSQQSPNGLPKTFMTQMQQLMTQQQEFIMQMSQKYGIVLKTVAQMKPKVEYCDRVLAAKNCLTTTVIAKDLGMSAVTLNRVLHARGVQFKRGDTWVLYAELQNHGLTDIRTTTYGNNNEYTQESMVWTQLGRAFIIKVVVEGLTPRQALDSLEQTLGIDTESFLQFPIPL